VHTLEPRLPVVSTWHRIAVGAILAVGLAVGVLLPDGRYCDSGVDRFRQWSYTNKEWSYGCGPGSSMPMDAKVDLRIPLRIAAGVVAFLLAWWVGRLLGRRRSFRPTTAREKQLLSSTILVAIYGLLGATLAIVLTFRQDSFCILRGPGSLSCSYKSFLGWDTAPILVDALWVVVGAAAGTVVGLGVAGLGQRFESPSPDVSGVGAPPAGPG
jgi:hypothetical protein